MSKKESIITCTDGKELDTSDEKAVLMHFTELVPRVKASLSLEGIDVVYDSSNLIVP